MGLTLGIMVWTGKAVDVMTVVLPTILFVVGISDVVHVLTLLRRTKTVWGIGGDDGLAKLIGDILTSATLGFLTLLTHQWTSPRLGIWPLWALGWPTSWHSHCCQVSWFLCHLQRFIEKELECFGTTPCIVVYDGHCITNAPWPFCGRPL